MKRTYIMLWALIGLLLPNACQRNSVSVAVQQDSGYRVIPFTALKNYFVRNDVMKSVESKIETPEKFEEIFGMATTMGEEGKPTEINFSQQFVIAVVLPETDTATTLYPLNLKKDTSGKLRLQYHVERGTRQSFTTRPFFAVAVSKSDNGPLLLLEQK